MGHFAGNTDKLTTFVRFKPVRADSNTLFVSPPRCETAGAFSMPRAPAPPGRRDALDVSAQALRRLPRTLPVAVISVSLRTYKVYNISNISNKNYFSLKKLLELQFYYYICPNE